MTRRFLIKEEGKQEVEYTGPYSYGRLNALRDYVKDHMPGWNVISAGHLVSNRDGFSWYEASAINSDQTLGARLWVKQPYGA